ncbi:transporter substrate-binding domain-containing protein [Amycolatopsis jejuensis]|uniref:transporter substrate-binding domain-containing protein n=1 Tax=Amycolatopsis jejuensis TaxID=330084 RepID=UPI0005254AD7|nr:transporter substrate-binding domain-containing protein [Amycolatopsis jejuensis]
MSRLRKYRLLAGGIAVALAVTACGGGPAAAPGGSTGTLHDLLPEEVSSKGVLVVGTGTTYVPVNFLADDKKTMTGFVPEIIEAMAAELKIKVEWTHTQLASILTGVSSRRYDAGIIFADTKQREQAASFLALYQEGRQYLVRADYNGPEVPPCGASIGVNNGSVDAARMPALSKTNCESKGQPAYRIASYPSTAASELALRSGRVEFVPSGAISLAYLVSHTSGVKVLGSQVDPAYYSMGIARDSTKLIDALKAAFQQVVKSGAYGRIMAKWNVSGFAIDKPMVDVAES